MRRQGLEVTREERVGLLDRARVLALCQEVEALCESMEDKDGLAFFRQARQQLQT